MMSLLVAGDRSPRADSIRSGGFSAGASLIVSETFGRVAQPPPAIRRETVRRNERKGRTTLMNSSYSVAPVPALRS
jgi:hypothetical protein